jgi:hypothetical protein
MTITDPWELKLETFCARLSYQMSLHHSGCCP